MIPTSTTTLTTTSTETLPLVALEAPSTTTIAPDLTFAGIGYTTSTSQTDSTGWALQQAIINISRPNQLPPNPSNQSEKNKGKEKMVSDSNNSSSNSENTEPSTNLPELSKEQDELSSTGD